MSSTSERMAVPKKTPRKMGFSTTTLIACMAAMPAGGGWRSSAHITVAEKARKKPAISPEPRAARRVRGHSADLDVFPEAEAVRHMAYRRPRRLIDRGGAVMALAGDHHIVERDAVRAGVVGGGLRRLLQPHHAHHRDWEIVVTAFRHDVVAFGDDEILQPCLHGILLLAPGDVGAAHALGLGR